VVLHSIGFETLSPRYARVGSVKLGNGFRTMIQMPRRFPRGFGIALPLDEILNSFADFAGV
jgi:hypothetical protein